MDQSTHKCFIFVTTITSKIGNKILSKINLLLKFTNNFLQKLHIYIKYLNIYIFTHIHIAAISNESL